METETTLVRAESRVELDSKTPVDGDGSVISLPDDTEVDDSLRDRDDVERTTVLWVGLEEWLKGRGDLVDRLQSGSASCNTPWREVAGAAYLLELGLNGKVGHCVLSMCMRLDVCLQSAWVQMTTG